MLKFVIVFFNLSKKLILKEYANDFNKLGGSRLNF